MKPIRDALSLQSSAPHLRARLIELKPRAVFCIAEMDGRILFHARGAELLPKHHMVLSFADGTALTATVGLWGFFGVGSPTAPMFEDQANTTDPLQRDFPLARFEQLFAEYPKPNHAIKAFLINRPRLRGFGNGYMVVRMIGARRASRQGAKVAKREGESRQQHDTAQTRKVVCLSPTLPFPIGAGPIWTVSMRGHDRQSSDPWSMAFADDDVVRGTLQGDLRLERCAVECAGGPSVHGNLLLSVLSRPPVLHHLSYWSKFWGPPQVIMRRSPAPLIQVKEWAHKLV